jgi:hypothetical protein
MITCRRTKGAKDGQEYAEDGNFKKEKGPEILPNPLFLFW